MPKIKRYAAGGTPAVPQGTAPQVPVNNAWKSQLQPFAPGGLGDPSNPNRVYGGPQGYSFNQAAAALANPNATAANWQTFLPPVGQRGWQPGPNEGKNPINAPIDFKGISAQENAQMKAANNAQSSAEFFYNPSTYIAGPTADPNAPPDTQAQAQAWAAKSPANAAQAAQWQQGAPNATSGATLGTTAPGGAGGAAPAAASPTKTAPKTAAGTNSQASDLGGTDFTKSLGTEGGSFARGGVVGMAKGGVVGDTKPRYVGTIHKHGSD